MRPPVKRQCQVSKGSEGAQSCIEKFPNSYFLKRFQNVRFGLGQRKSLEDFFRELLNNVTISRNSLLCDPRFDLTQISEPEVLANDSDCDYLT